MVTQDGHSPVGPVVGQDLGWNILLRWGEREIVCLISLNVCRIIHDSLLLIANESFRYAVCIFYLTPYWTIGGDIPLVSSFSCCCRVIEAL